MAETPSQMLPDAAEDARVLAVIAQETQAFLSADYDAWAACWVQDARTQDIYVSATAGLSVLTGWPAVAAHMQGVFQNGLGCAKARIEQRNPQVSIAGTMAWVVFDGWSEDVAGVTTLNFETRILEYAAGTWRIVYSSVMERHAQDARDDEISLNEDGRVIGASAACREKLKSHPVLTISAGRIRAQRRDWDKVLQKEITRAGRYHGYFQLRQFAAETGGAFQYPAVLGDTLDGGVAVVLISVRDCVTCIHIDSDGLVDHRLTVAQAVYGLSDGQMRVARRIAQGDGLSQAATTLGVSVNTARTHLSRIFDKTGVKAQTALVRLLLSVG